MARHGDARSPSPVGSSYSSKRNRRVDDHYDKSRRDDGRGTRRKSRSRSPEVRHFGPHNAPSFTDLCRLQKDRYRDRDVHRRRDRSIDRRDDDRYRSGRRDRSRDRRRSRDREVVKDYRNKSRERDHRDRRDTSRDRNRRPRDVSTDSRRNGRRNDSREQPSPRQKGSEKLEVSPRFYGRMGMFYCTVLTVIAFETKAGRWAYG